MRRADKFWKKMMSGRGMTSFDMAGSVCYDKNERQSEYE